MKIGLTMFFVLVFIYLPSQHITAWMKFSLIEMKMLLRVTSFKTIHIFRKRMVQLEDFQREEYHSEPWSYVHPVAEFSLHQH